MLSLEPLQALIALHTNIDPRRDQFIANVLFTAAWIRGTALARRNKAAQTTCNLVVY